MVNTVRTNRVMASLFTDEDLGPISATEAGRTRNPEQALRYLREQQALKVAKTRDDIHGITRARIGGIMESVDQGGSFNIEDEALIRSEILKRLANRGITDRYSFERVLFGYDNIGAKRTANWYENSGIRGLFPTTLVEIVLGRKLKKALTEADLKEAGDKLFGQLDKRSLVDEVTKTLKKKGITSREQVLTLDDEGIANIAKETSAGSATILFRILAGTRPKLLSKPMNQELADVLFPSV